MDELERDAMFPTLPECPECDGTGEVPGDDDLDHTCPYCGGGGFEEPPDLEDD